MAVKKIIQNVFEQVREVGGEMAKSSAKQVKETFSPWDMIRNSFSETSDSPDQNAQSKLKEMQGKAEKHTPLDFDKLQKNYANQDQKNIESMKQRLFQLVKREEEQTLMRGKQKKTEKERAVTQEDADRRRREDDKKKQQSFASAPQGKTGRGSALSGKKRKKPTEPQPAETKPGSGKQ